MGIIIYAITSALLLSQIFAFSILFIEKRRINKKCNAMLQLIGNLEDGIAKNSRQMGDMQLEYKQAQEAANRINDFGASLASIFDYDPIMALRKEREKVGGNH